MERSAIRDKCSPEPPHRFIHPMVRYRRNFVPGGTFFFTVTLADRRSLVLTE
jgi:hypothetical protein